MGVSACAPTYTPGSKTLERSYREHRACALGAMHSRFVPWQPGWRRSRASVHGQTTSDGINGLCASGDLVCPTILDIPGLMTEPPSPLAPVPLHCSPSFSLALLVTHTWSLSFSTSSSWIITVFIRCLYISQSFPRVEHFNSSSCFSSRYCE